MLDSLACALVKLIGWICCRLPAPLAVGLGSAVGRVGVWARPKRARIGYLNLKAAFGARLTPTQARRIVRQVFANMGAGVVEMLRLPVLDAASFNRYIQIVDRFHIEQAAASARPVVFLTSHFGNWELCSITAALIGFPIVALARAQQKFPKLYRLLVSYRESKGCRIVHKGGEMRQFVQALRRRELVGMVGDQASRQGILVEFFGRPAWFATGPFELARSSGALIVPAFIHRIRGPRHRLVVERPLDLSQVQGSPDEVVRVGIDQFAQILTRHIEEDPAQWLWLHKRWKHTPARRVLILSDAKAGHVKQSLTVLQALKERCSSIQERVIEIRYRHRLGRVLAFLWAWLGMPFGGLRVLQWALTPTCFREAAGSYADLIISCGASVAPINVLLSADNSAKSVVVMDPGLPLSRFCLALVPLHDEVASRPNVVQVLGALSTVSDPELTAAREGLRAHPNFRLGQRASDGRPVIAVLLGGETDEYEVTSGFVDTLLRQILAVCEDIDGSCLVTTSRRTSPAVERLLSERLARHPRCGLLLLASRDDLNGTVPGMLGWASVVVVTGESISMLSEACASGRPVVVVEPPAKPTRAVGATKPRRFLRTLVERGYVHHHPMPEVGHAIRRCLSAKTPARRLDTYAMVREAVAKLL